MTSEGGDSGAGGFCYGMVLSGGALEVDLSDARNCGCSREGSI